MHFVCVFILFVRISRVMVNYKLFEVKILLIYFIRHLDGSLIICVDNKKLVYKSRVPSIFLNSSKIYN